MPGNRIALIIGLICAFIASFLVFQTMQNNAKQLEEAKRIKKIDVVFAKVLIPARTRVTADQVEVRKVPEDGVPPNVATKISDVVDLATRTDILANEPVNMDRIVREGEDAGMAFLIPPGMRAITIAVDEVIGVAGFIRPGERVDVIGTIELKNSQTGSTTWTVVQDVEVLAVSQEMTAAVREDRAQNNNDEEKEKARLGTSVTLAVTPYQAQKIALSEERGSLRLTLRPALKEPEVKVAPVRESGLIPFGADPGVRGQPGAAPQTRRVEIISGNKVDYVTVY